MLINYNPFITVQGAPKGPGSVTRDCLSKCLMSALTPHTPLRASSPALAKAAVLSGKPALHLALLGWLF